MRNAVIDAFITEAIERNDLQFGGGGGGYDQRGIAEPLSGNAVTESQRTAVEKWLGLQPHVIKFEVGPLFVDSMAEDGQMQIRIRYQVRQEAEPRELELSPEEYFDPPVPGESLNISSSVARLLDTFQYTPYSADELLWTVVEIRHGERFSRLRTQLLDGMRTLMHHSENPDGTEEIIHSTQLGPDTWHTVRTFKQPGQTWSVMLNKLVVERPDESPEFRDYCEAWSTEELKGFGIVQ